MNHELHLSSDLGINLAEGARAAEYRLRAVETVLGVYETVTFDFDGVKGMNSSFANALIVPLFSIHGSNIRKKLRFRHCSPMIRVVLESALTLGMQAGQEHDRMAAAVRG